MSNEDEEFDNPLKPLFEKLGLVDAEEAHKTHAVHVDAFHRKMHAFLGGLDKEQLISLYELLTACITMGTLQLGATAATVSTYLMLKHDYCAATSAPSGEKMGVTSLDPSMLLGDDDHT
jgi:hypothetical protein